METLAPSKVTAPFGKINIWRQPDGSKKVRAYVLVEGAFEGAKSGIAIDGSLSMKPAYGLSTGVLGFLVGKRAATNVVSVEARKMSSYLASHLDVDGKTAVIYWATGSGKNGIETVGDLTEAEATKYDFKGPARFGTRTRLAPAVRYFVDRFGSARWGMYVFITDGVLDDLDAVKKYSIQLAREIEAGNRTPLKLVVIGVGPHVDEKQMVELDNLETGTAVDLWDHKIATEMSQLAEIFTEVVDETMILADSGVIRDELGAVVKDYRDTGVPALLEFSLPAKAAKAFTLEIGGQIIRQPLP